MKSEKKDFKQKNTINQLVSYPFVLYLGKWLNVSFSYFPVYFSTMWIKQVTFSLKQYEVTFICLKCFLIVNF